MAESSWQPSPPIPARELRKVSERFCASDSDITLQSSDAVLFEVHRKNLEVHSEGFAGADAISSSATKEVVPLSENSAVLELLLQYMYRQPQPDLRNVEFTTLAALAEATEKYQVYSATTVCNIFMRNAIDKHAPEILSYAFKHNYPDILDEAAPLTIRKPKEFLSIASNTAPGLLLVWIKYQQFWTDALDAAHKTRKLNYKHRGHTGHRCPCDGLWGDICARTAQNLGGHPRSLTCLQTVFASGEDAAVECDICQDEVASWRSRVQRLVDDIPKFSSLL